MTTTWTHPFERAGLGLAPFRFTHYTKAVYQAFPGAPIQSGSTCDYCGQAIMHVYHIEDRDGRKFKVGCECVLKTERTAPESMTALTAQIKAERAKLAKERRIARKEARRQERLVAFRKEAEERKAKALETYHDLAELLKLDHDAPRDIARKFERTGWISERTIEFLRALKVRLAVIKPIPVPDTGNARVEIVGHIVTLRNQEGPYGTQTKMLVVVEKDGGEFKLWGTCPSVLLDIGAGYIDRSGTRRLQPPGDRFPLRGCKVRFTAKIKRSDRDESFGFFDRPTKPAVVA